MTLIELGEVSSGWHQGRTPGKPPRLLVRRLVVLAVAVLCVLTVTGSERPEPRSLPTLWSAPYPGVRFALTPDTLYLHGPGKTPSLTAYDAATGSVRWTRQSKQPEGWISTDVPGLVLVQAVVDRKVEDNGESYVEPIEISIALDARTGAERWRADGIATGWDGELALLTEWSTSGSGLNGFRGVRASDGKVVWAKTPDYPVAFWTTTGPVPGRPDRLVLSDGDGRVEVRRISDGSVVRQATVPTESVDEGSPRLHSSGPVLFMVEPDGVEQTMTAYDTDTLRPRWTRTIGKPPHYFDCGTLLCLAGGQYSVEAIDPVTGEARWRSDNFDHTTSLPGTDRMLVEQSHSGRTGLIDSVTGRRILEFPPGTALVDPVTGGVVAVGPYRTASAPTTVTQFTDDELVLRGSLSSIADAGCQLAAGRLACAHENGTLTVTDVG